MTVMLVLGEIALGSISANYVNCITTASVTGGATARLALHVSLI